MLTPRRANYRGLARLEWLQLLVFTFPIVFVVPVMALVRYGPGLALVMLFEYGKETAVLAVLYIGVGLFVAFAFDIWRSYIAGISANPLPIRIQDRFEEAMRDIYGPDRTMRISNFQWCPEDMLVGAHVRGIFRPTVVMSAGMVIGFCRRDPRAVAILSHELAHVEHYDRLLPGFMGLVIVDALGSCLSFYVTARQEVAAWDLMASGLGLLIYKTLVFATLLCLISRGREYYADASADQITAPAGTYATLLEAVQGRETERLSFFHPSMSNRVDQAKRGFPSLRHRWPWRLYFLVATLTSFTMLQLIPPSEDGLYLYCNVCVGLAVLVSELIRIPILRSRISFAVPIPGRPLVRYAILFGGFIVAVFAGATSGSQMVMSIVGAGAFGLFTALKGWSRSGGI